MTIPRSFATRTKIGVTRVTGLQKPPSLAPQGFERNPVSSLALPRNPDGVTSTAACNPATGYGVTFPTKTGYVQTPASQSAAAGVTHVTRVTPIFERSPKVSADASSDCGGLPVEDGPFFPWGPYLSPDDVRQLRDELRATVDELAAREGWPLAHQDEILSLSMNGSLANLLRDLAHFGARLRERRAQAAERERLAPFAKVREAT
ncbi:hypothetical protein B0G84_2454 [Paraburkholderia sp. BL8N3]|nr:hypothetical protein B0G84_2454 [Paraburkholderia sp. BL8N3]